MKGNTSKTFAYIGAGIGLTIFALFGLMFGSFFGGIIGLQINVQIFGAAAEVGILPRIVVSLGVMFGVLLAAVACVAGSSMICYLVGRVIDLVHIETKSVAKSHQH